MHKRPMKVPEDKMKESLLKYAIQFSYVPTIENANNHKIRSSFVVSGMGGSNQASELMKRVDPLSDIIVHREYGLPKLSKAQWEDRLVIISSHSGNTEEPLDSLERAITKGIPCAAITSGGKLLRRAIELGIPYINIPHEGFQPRMATGYQFMALAAIMGKKDVLSESSILANTLDTEDAKERGRSLSTSLSGSIPIIYASDRNRILAYMWKITMNETGKSLAFYNVVPEMNHNEIEGFNPNGSTHELVKHTTAIFILDEDDHPRIQKRMDVFADVLKGSSIKCINETLSGDLLQERLFFSILTAAWTAYFLATDRGLDPQDIPVLESFKQQI